MPSIESKLDSMILTPYSSFKEEYGVKIIQSNFDSMEGMQAKLAAGNRTTSSSRRQWVQKLAAASQLTPIDHTPLENAAAIFDHYDYFADPGTTRLRALGPVHDVQDRDRLAQGQARRR